MFYHRHISLEAIVISVPNMLVNVRAKGPRIVYWAFLVVVRVSRNWIWMKNWPPHSSFMMDALTFNSPFCWQCLPTRPYFIYFQSFQTMIPFYNKLMWRIICMAFISSQWVSSHNLLLISYIPLIRLSHRANFIN